MPTIQFGDRQVKIKVNPTVTDYIIENASRQFEPQWNEQVTDEDGNVVLDMFADKQKVTKTFDALVLNASDIDTETEIEALVGSMVLDDQNVKLGVITAINEATPAGRGLKLNLTLAKYNSITY
jgi:hypothetical protein